MFSKSVKGKEQEDDEQNSGKNKRKSGTNDERST